MTSSVALVDAPEELFDQVDRLDWLVEVHPVAGTLNRHHVLVLDVIWEYLLVHFEVINARTTAYYVQGWPSEPQRLIKVWNVLKLSYQCLYVDSKLYWVNLTVLLIKN